MNKGAYLTSLLAMGLLASDFPMIPESKVIEIDGNTFNVPPKGCKEYFFNKKGEFSTEKMLKSECVFKCFAINDRNAINKFQRFLTRREAK
jgi:hypothetical protein